VNENPLGGSVYDDGLDPWSAAPSPSPPPMPTAPSLFSSVIGEIGGLLDLMLADNHL
jgi:sorting nexin-8